MKEAGLPCQGDEPNSKDALKDFCDGFEKNNNAEGGQGVVGRLAGFVKDNPVCVFESGGMVPEGDQWC